MGMVFQHSIPFAAPSQLRLELVPAPEVGWAWLTVVDQFHHPMGNLCHLSVNVNELLALVHGRRHIVDASGEKAACCLKVPNTPHPVDVEVTYEDFDRHRMVHTSVTFDDLRDLVYEVAQAEGLSVA